jgi:hypothetical protein
MAIESSGGPLVGKAYLMATFAYLNSSDLSKGWTQFDPVRGKMPFWSQFYFKRPVYRDRLGTNVRKVEGERRLLQATHHYTRQEYSACPTIRCGKNAPFLLEIVFI